MTEEDLILTLEQETVLVTAGENHASGVILGITDEEVTVVTAGHLMEGYSQGIITFTTGNTVFGNVECCSEDPDLCILTVERQYIEESLIEELSEAETDESRYEALSKGSTVYLVGSAIAAGSNAVKGTVAAKDFYVEEFDARFLYLYVQVMAGMSGCGVYDEDGFLVGILTGGSESGEAAAVSLPQIEEKWEEIQNDKD